MQIVSNTSPLIILKKSGAIQILGKLFDEVIITSKIREELYRKEKEFFEKARFVKVVEGNNQNLVNALSVIVDEGEAEAIALALEGRLPLLIDDLKGRKLSESLGMKYIGTLGLLKIAKNKGIIDEIRPIIEKFLEDGYYLDTGLIEKFLEKSGEG